MGLTNHYVKSTENSIFFNCFYTNHRYSTLHKFNFVLSRDGTSSRTIWSIFSPKNWTKSISLSFVKWLTNHYEYIRLYITYINIIKRLQVRALSIQTLSTHIKSLLVPTSSVARVYIFGNWRAQPNFNKEEFQTLKNIPLDLHRAWYEKQDPKNITSKFQVLNC